MPEVPMEELERLVRETRQLAEDNNRLLRLIRRDALLGFIGKLVLWLLVLGVPLFFLSTYLGPLMNAFAPAGEQTIKPGVFGLPSEEQLDQLIKAYQGE